MGLNSTSRCFTKSKDGPWGEADVGAELGDAVAQLADHINKQPYLVHQPTHLARQLPHLDSRS